MPVLTSIAGPNGSGKSTLGEWVDMQGRGLMLDADAIVRRMNASDPASVALAAGRELLELTDDYFDRRLDFAVESTLSSHASINLMLTAKSKGYLVHLVFVALDSPEKCISRVQNRVLRGGHFIPDADVRRRYAQHGEPAKSG